MVLPILFAKQINHSKQHLTKGSTSTLRIDLFVGCAAVLVAVKIGLPVEMTVTSSVTVVKIGSSVGTAVTSAAAAVVKIGSSVGMAATSVASVVTSAATVASFAVHPASLAVHPASFVVRSACLICLKYF